MYIRIQCTYMPPHTLVHEECANRHKQVCWMAVRLYLCTTYTGIIITKINIAAFHSILYIHIHRYFIFCDEVIICASDASFVSVELEHCMFRVATIMLNREPVYYIGMYIVDLSSSLRYLLWDLSIVYSHSVFVM